VQFHRKIPVHESYVIPPTTVMDEEQCLQFIQIPMFKVAIFLFIQTVKPHSWRNKYAIETFNSVWYREDAALMQPVPVPGAVPPGGMSPQFKGSASPPAPHSPHTVGMQDRSTSDAYYLEFIREKLGDLFTLLYPSAAMSDDSASTISAEQIDLLGFLLCSGGSNMLDFSQSLSTAYPKWQPSGDTSTSAESHDASTGHVDNAVKICQFFKTHLYLNETLYPPVGFSLNAHALVSSGSFSPITAAVAGRDFKLNGDAGPETSNMSEEEENNIMQRPTVLSNLSKTTVIKRAEDFVDRAGNSDLVIFSCHDAHIYIVGPVRYPFPVSLFSSCCCSCGLPSLLLISLTLFFLCVL
jgi:hypothetical protein